MGDKQANLEQAIDNCELAASIFSKESSVFDDEPWGGVEQDNFANQIEVETWLPAPVLLETLEGWSQKWTGSRGALGPLLD